ncbi:MAG TPA: protein kinase [Polyangiaceae bacterium LLY-WYZ-15_(1-7)]|nr:hypothetical protein [Sandaracinus sp.]MBJ70026.1 hypothetical protein [Sandaracinus sp.]HJL05652.1 protein kinase [Polyangiaceae bacterium LLY-WYZ-15_(1-7)]HJL08040.1 protein kinase [Polyangiaceae bacterium LLY-WYZ-15_(1-7)]HJL36380.1 protein kinase [Polyangiaceae bacterium LLY-WYZ-15_(1-7)]
MSEAHPEAAAGRRDADTGELAGETLDGRYAVEGKLGEGGMAVVYAGRHLELARPVAIKVIRRRVLTHEKAIERFQLEARTASQLGHPNIVDVFDLGRLPDGRPYMVMPRLRGMDLERFLREEGPQPAPRVAELLAGPAAALDALHAQGLVHRDVKLENLFVERQPGVPERVLLMDFGLAAVAGVGSRLTREDTVLGTPHYLPPENATGQKAGIRGDLYALGVVAYELLVGRTPFDDDEPLRLLATKMHRDAPAPSARAKGPLPPETDALFARVLSREPEARPSSCAAFVEELGTLGVAGSATSRARRDGTDELPLSFDVGPGTETFGGTPGAGAPGTDAFGGTPGAGAPGTDAVGGAPGAGAPGAGAVDDLPPSFDVGPGGAEARGAAPGGGATDELPLRFDVDPGGAEARDGAPGGGAIEELPPSFDAAPGGPGGHGLAGPAAGDGSASPGAGAAGDAAREERARVARQDTYVLPRRRARGPMLALLLALIAAPVAWWGLGRESPKDAVARSEEEAPPPGAEETPAPEAIAPGEVGGGGVEGGGIEGGAENGSGGDLEPTGEARARAAAASADEGEALEGRARRPRRPSQRAEAPTEATPAEGGEAAAPTAEAAEAAEPPEARELPAAEPPPTPQAAEADRERAAERTAEANRMALRGLLPQALDAYRQATLADPRYAPAWRGAGITHERLGHDAEAARAYRRYLRLAPRAADAGRIRARLDAL